MQSARLYTEAYEKAFIVENNLRAFASKVLIYFLGIDWLNSIGLEKQAESVKNLKQKFTQRVPEFEDINTDFLSMTLWVDLFVPFIDEPDKFKQAIHNFIEDRNHVAHSKVLSWSSYQIVLNDFNKMDDFIRMADSKFDREETSYEVLDTWNTIEEEEHNEREYYRERLASETGIDILDEENIRD